MSVSRSFGEMNETDAQLNYRLDEEILFDRSLDWARLW